MELDSVKVDLARVIQLLDKLTKLEEEQDEQNC